MTFKTSVLATATTLFLSLPAMAADLDPFSDFFVFGDSLSDPGNIVNELLGAPVSPIPGLYDNAQFTDGDAWATQLGADFASGTNFAFGAARAAPTGPFNIDLPLGGGVLFDVPDLPDQIAAFGAALAGGILTPGPNPLAAIAIGGNDIRNAFTAADPAAELATAVSSILGGVGSLISQGISRVAVLGVPNIGLLPETLALGPIATDLATATTVAFNDALRTGLAGFGNPNITYFDTFALFEEVAANPAAFGFANTTDSCVTALLIGSVSECSSFLFYDSIHPTEAVHTILAERFAQSVQPARVPLPASGLLLLVALGTVALRRKAT